MASIRAFDDWRQVLTLRVVVPLILAAVSFYYLTLWAHANAMPGFLAWTLPAALDVTAYKAVTVARHAANKAAQRKASALAWICVLLSVAGNIGSHALEVRNPAGVPLLTVNIWTIAATSMVYPLMLIAGHIVAGGMSKRPMRPAEIDQVAGMAAMAMALTRLTATAERAKDEAAAAVAEARELRAEKRRRPAPTQAPTYTPTYTPTYAPAQVSAPAPAPAPAAAPAAPAPSPAPAPAAAPAAGVTEQDRHEAAVAYLREHPEHGRRMLLRHLNETLDPTITDHACKKIHREALDALTTPTTPSPAVAPAPEPARASSEGAAA
jgi:hypothetical protein